MLEVLLLYLIIPGRILFFFNCGVMVVLVNKANVNSSVVRLTGFHSMPPWLNLSWVVVLPLPLP